MWKPIYDPGPWKAFLGRKDIKGLPIMEAKKKYVEEQLLFENYLNTLNTVNTVNTVSPASAGVAGGQRKFKYAAQYRLVYRGEGDTPLKAGVYDRVAISDLKRYWYDNFFDGQKGFSVPPPSIPSNIGSDYFFIKEIEGKANTVNLITWGSLGRGRQRGQWTYSEYKLGLAIACNEYYNRWLNGFGFGSSNLSTPTGKWKINSLEGGGKYEDCITPSYPYELTEVSPSPGGSLTVTGGSPLDTTYIGNYTKDPSSGTGQDAVYLREDDQYKIYYNDECAMWRIDSTGIIKISCADWTGNPTGTSPLGRYRLSMARFPQTGIYTVT